MTGTTTSARSGDSRARHDFGNSPTTAMVVIVVASTMVALLAPDMVTGSTHEHLPLAALTVWPWTAAAVGYVFMAGRGNDSRDLVLGVTFVWAWSQSWRSPYPQWSRAPTPPESRFAH